ncbi:MAG TPA: DUF6572 domain-containing protein [Reyranella sp.]|jgi:hypothetical protein|nr:DUF6572 domain-containing protein [Reyranella sp.]
MSIEETNKIDFTAIDKNGRHILLAISDPLDWSNENEHLSMLQDKLNAYFTLIDSGQLIEKVPKAKGLPVIIRIVGKYPLSHEAAKFLDLAKSEFAKDSITLEFQLLDDGSTTR